MGKKVFEASEMYAEHNLTSNFVTNAAFQKSSQGDDGRALHIISRSNVEVTVHEPATS